MLVLPAVIETVGVTELVTAMVTELLLEVLVDWQLLLLVITTLIASLFTGAARV